MPIPDEQTLATELTELIQTQVLEPAEPLQTDTPLFENGLDSMAIMQLLLLIEQRYGVMLSASELTAENFARPRDIARLLHGQLAADAAGQQEPADDDA